DVSVVQPASKRGDRNNFGPRVGFAWDPGQNGVTNIHAGYGMFYDNMRTLQNFGGLTWPQAKPIIIHNPNYADPYQGKARDQFLSTAPPNVTVMDNHAVNPYAHQFNVGISRSITSTLAVAADVTMVYRYSDRDTVDPNLPDQTTGAKKFPQFARVNFWQSTADNRYKALLVKLEKRMSKHYQYLVSYTLSKADDDNFINSLGDRYGYFKIARPGVADRRHRVVTSGIVELPARTQVSVIADFRSSLPFSPSTSLDLNRDGYTGDLPAGVLPGSGCRSLDLNAVNAFRSSRNLTPVGQVDCPTYANVDIRFSKFFRIGPSQRAELIAQLFNVVNRVNFATPAVSLTGGNEPNARPLIGPPNALS